MLKDKKGLINGLVFIMVFLFVLGLVVVFSNFVWSNFNSGVQGLDSSVADNETKQTIDDLGSKIAWGNKIFAYLLMALLIGFLVTSFTLPARSTWFFVLYAGFLVIVLIISMFLSNAWTVIMQQPDLIVYLSSLGFIDIVMRSYPFIIFFIGLVGGLIFYIRTKDEGNNFVGGEEEF